MDRVFNTTYKGIAAVGRDGNGLKIKDRVCYIFGYTRSELYNRTMDLIVCIQDLSVHEKKYKKFVRGKIDEYSLKQGYTHEDASIIG